MLLLLRIDLLPSAIDGSRLGYFEVKFKWLMIKKEFFLLSSNLVARRDTFESSGGLRLRICSSLL